MGCFQDDRRDRRLPVSHMNDTEMTPQVSVGVDLTCLMHKLFMRTSDR